MHVAVLGAGLAGLASAWELARSGLATTVVEKAPRPGGMAASWQVGPYWLDCGPHRFHTRDQELLRHLYEILDNEVVMRERRSRIHLLGKYFDYPLRATNVLRGLPPGLLLRAVWDYAAARAGQFLRPRPDAHFEAWVVKRFGRTLYDLFFGTYTSKAWGMPCTEISADWAAQRISQANLWDAIVKTLWPPREGEVRSLVTEFHYPAYGGVGQIARKYAEKAEALGARIHLGAAVRRIALDGRRVVRVEWDGRDGPRAVEPERVISTIPLPVALSAFDPPPAEDVRAAIAALRYIAIVFVYLEVPRPSVIPDHWVYLPSKELTVHRISEFKNFSDASAPGDSTVVCCEITCPPGQGAWNFDLEQAAAVAEADLVRIGLLQPGEARGIDLLKLSHAYPVYDLDYARHLEVLRGAVAGLENFHTTGRQGLFRYNNMDHSILMGRRMAREIVEGADTRSDEVATGSEYFG